MLVQYFIIFRSSNMAFMKHHFHIDPDITKAETLPGWFYGDEVVFEQIKEKIFLKSWQWVGDDNLAPFEEYAYPFTLLDGYLDEPLLLTRDKGGLLNCLSNVCTHRGNLVVNSPGKLQKLICMYHGRRFDLGGRFEYMPEFAEAVDFPRPCEDLPGFEVKQWGPMIFTGLEPAFDLDKVIDSIKERVGFLPLEALRFHSERSKDYLVNAHWALYCDNYLEGFHIPFVHKGLNAALDYGNYTTLVYDYFNLQIGYSENSDDVFDLPAGHVDEGKKVAAYYYWLFPNMMFNFYPWGLSVNIVKPQAIDRTRVSFLTYVYDESRLDSGAGGELDKVEQEDEFVVENVQKGVGSRYYGSGRFSPNREQGVHHFHRLLADFLNRD